jgi:hypothetical protein
MFMIPFLFILGLSQSIHARTYTKLTGGTASASSYQDAAHNPSKGFDSDESTFWISTPEGYGGVGTSPPSLPAELYDTEWLQYQLTTSKVVTRYCVKAGAFTTWSFQGSSNGSTWTTLDEGSYSQSGQMIDINNTTAYTYYRVLGYGAGYVEAAVPYPVIPGLIYFVCKYIVSINELELYTPDPPAVTFSASPATINLGASSTLIWNASDATSVSFIPSIGSTALSGTKSVSPTTNTTYKLTATGIGGTTIKNVTVSIAPPTASFSASPTIINPGGSSTLSWSTTNATSVSFSPSIGSAALNGEVSVSPSTNTTYTLTVSGPGGTIYRYVTVNIVPTASFSASSTIISYGGSSTLTWSTTNATSVSFSPPIGSTALSGSQSVSPTMNTTYTLTATGPGGAITKTATVNIVPTASFSASPTTITVGASSTLTWSTTNATSVYFSPPIGSTALSGTKSVSLLDDTIYTMTVTGPGGSITKTATVNVVLPPKGAEYTYDELGRIRSIIRSK